MTAERLRVDVDEVRAELRIEDVVERYDLADRTDKPTARLPRCPRCGLTSSSTAIVINFRKQTWGHYGHGKREAGQCYGDALALLAACEGLDSRRDFAKLVDIAAQIAGVEARELSPEDREARRLERERRRVERERQAAEEDARRHEAAKWLAAGEWGRMIHGRGNAAGERYLRSRGLFPRPFIDADQVRFDEYGNVCIPLFDFAGTLINVVRRRVITGEPKVVGLKDCPTRGTLSGRIQEIAATGTIVCEGVIDTLTAIQRWPGRTVLGAHGGGQLHDLVEAAAPRVREAGGKLVLVPDADDIGKRQAIRAGEAALRAGLVMDRTLLVVEVEPYRDLNDAHCKGWKP